MFRAPIFFKEDSMTNNYYVGDKVKIKLPRRSITVTREMRRFDGQITKISKITTSNINGGRQVRQYELKGIRSKKNKPFTFLSDMFVKVED